MEYQFGPTPGAQDMQARQQRELEQPIVCPECGSKWFTEVNYSQYSDSAVGSGTGGDIRVISNTVQTLRVCICGSPFSPSLTGVRGRTATIDLVSFQESLKKAQDMRATIVKAGKAAPVRMDSLAQSFAGVSEVQRLEDAVKEISRKVGNLETKSSLIGVATLEQHSGILRAEGIQLPTETIEPGKLPVANELLAPEAVHGTVSLSNKERKAAEKAAMEKAGR